MSLRFKVGDMAIFVFAKNASGSKYQGQQISIVGAGPWEAGDRWRAIKFPFRTDYLIEASDGARGVCCDYQLRKIDPPVEPQSLTRSEEVEA